MNLQKLLPLFFLIVSANYLYAGNAPTNKQLLDNKSPSFVENKGQLADEKGHLLNDVKFYTHDNGPDIYCRPGKISFVFSKVVDNDGKEIALFGMPESPKDAIKKRLWLEDQISNQKTKIITSRTDLVLVNPNPDAKIKGQDMQASYENYYSSYTPESGINKAGTYKTVVYEGIYQNIDMVLHMKENAMKYEFIIHPGGRVSDIKMQWNGLDAMQSFQDGGLHYISNMIDMRDSKPVSFVTSGAPVTSSFAKNDNVVSFNVAPYDHSQTLTIDPTLTWATYFGGGSRHFAQAVWTDAASNVLITGPTSSTSAVGTSGSFQSTFAGTNSNAFLAKFDVTGSLKWCTYYGGGGSAYNDGWGLSTDNKNNIFMAGATSATSGIATSGSFQSLLGGTGSATYNGYVAKFTPAGNRVWGTYYGSTGNDQVLFVATDQSYNVFLVAWASSSSGLASSGAYQSVCAGQNDFGVAKFDSSGQKELWSTYFGGQGNDLPNNIATDLKGNCIVVGGSTSTGLATANAPQTANNGSQDALIVSFSPSGGVNWSTYLGGTSSDYAWGDVTDQFGNVYVTGQTSSTKNVSTAVPYQKYLAGSSNTFLAKYTLAGALVWSTYYGGGSTDNANNIAVDPTGSAFITGSTNSSYGIATSGAYMTALKSSSGSNAFFSKFSPAGNLMYGSYYGDKGVEIAWDIHSDPTNGITYLVGQTTSSSNMATSGAFQTSYVSSTADAFIAGFTFKDAVNDAGIAMLNSPLTSFCVGSSKSVTASLENFGTKDLTAVTIGWSVNKKVQTPVSWTGTLKKNEITTVTLGTYSFPAGTDTIKIWTSKPNGVVDTVPQNDTLYAADTIYAYPTPKVGATKLVCSGISTSLGSTAIPGHSYSWVSNPSGFTSTSSQVSVTPTVNTTYYLTETVIGAGCASLDSGIVNVHAIPTPNVGSTKTICYGGSTTIGTNPAITGHTYTWSSVPAGFTSTAAQPTVNPLKNTTYYVTETDTVAGCYAYANGSINVSNPLVANAGGNHTSCAGNAVALGSAATTGHTYSWTSNKSKTIFSTASNPTVNPLVTTTYYVAEVITATGCIKIDSAVVTIAPAPKANAGGKNAICAGSNITLGAAATTGHTYSWSSIPVGFTSTASNPTASPASQTTYIVTETNTATGCSATDTAVISTNPLPVPTTGGNATICLGTKYQLGVSATTGHTYSWSSKPAGLASTASSPSVTPSVSTTYYLKETITATGCNKTDSAVITVSTVTPNAGGNHTICEGASVALGAPTVTDHAYAWSSHPGTYTSIESNPTVKPSVTTTYILTETILTSGCTKKDSAIIKVNPAPAAKTATSPATICLGSSINIGADAVSGNTYSWDSKPNSLNSIENNPSVSPKSSTWYYLTETVTATGCTKTDSIKVNVLPVPNAKWFMDYTGKTTFLHALDSSLADASYHWKFGDGDSSIGHLVNHIYPKNKNYNVVLVVRGTNGCTSEHDSSMTVIVSGIDPNKASGNAFNLNIYPNPFHGTTTVTYHLTQTTNVKIALFDITGKQVGNITNATQAPGNYQADINADNYHLMPGTYLVKFIMDDAVISKQLIKF